MLTFRGIGYALYDVYYWCSCQTVTINSLTRLWPQHICNCDSFYLNVYHIVHLYCWSITHLCTSYVFSFYRETDIKGLCKAAIYEVSTQIGFFCFCIVLLDTASPGNSILDVCNIDYCTRVFAYQVCNVCWDM